MKYQVRIKDTMADYPASGLYDNYADALNKMALVAAEVAQTWATPDGVKIYIFRNNL